MKHHTSGRPFSGSLDEGMIDPVTGMDTEVLNPRDEGPLARKYEILRVVNRGGMGEIAMGRVKGTKGFEKLVVLKRLRADAEREDHIAMFDVEQEVMSRIEHPNIVKVFDQPMVEGIPYLAMEYVCGRNLDQLIREANKKNEAISYPVALTVISEVLRGLAFVHRMKDGEGRALGVVHQDMTPSNVMLSFFGEVKITDFGISYVTSRDGGLRKGVLKGKPRYVAPEVLAGKRVNNRADIYGVGVVLYELLKGRALFARNSVKETLAAVARNELPDFAEVFPDYGPTLSNIFARSLSKEPGERYRTAEEMAADVLHELAKHGGPVPPASLGYFLRGLFENDPDVPEMDPALEEAMLEGAVSADQAAMKPRDLDETLQELDRLLGPTSTTSSSLDMFELPPDVQRELADLSDMDPFMALTPIPEFVWEAKSEEELLSKAEEAYPTAPPMFSEPPVPPRGPASPVQEPSAAPAADAAPDDTSSEDIAFLRQAARKQPSGTYAMVNPPARSTAPEARTPVADPARVPASSSASRPAPRPRDERPPSNAPDPTPGASRSFWLGLALGALAGASAGAAVAAFALGAF